MGMVHKLQSSCSDGGKSRRREGTRFHQLLSSTTAQNIMESLTVVYSRERAMPTATLTAGCCPPVYCKVSHGAM